MTSITRRPGRAGRARRKRRRNLLRAPLRRWRALPPALRIALGAAAVVATIAALNIVYQVLRKPTELLFPVAGALDKTPEETWRRYGSLFRAHATAAIPAELLAALAQAEGAGNPLARTYWRWRLDWNPFAVYRPASSAVGMYQMTDGAFAEARRYCIHAHVVVAEGACWFNALYMRVLPGHAVELAAIYLDRNVAAILARHPGAAPRPRQAEELAALVHVCGPGPADAFARRGFHLAAGERCGDHDPAAYLARVDALKRRFRSLAKADRDAGA